MVLWGVPDGSMKGLVSGLQAFSRILVPVVDDVEDRGCARGCEAQRSGAICMLCIQIPLLSVCLCVRCDLGQAWETSTTRAFIFRDLAIATVRDIAPLADLYLTRV